MAGHKFVKGETAKQGETNRAEKTFPRFFPADVRHHQMPSNYAPGQVCAHIGEFGDGNQIQNVELAGKMAVGRTRSEIHNLRDEIVKPEHVQQPEQRVSHGLQRFVIPKSREHLPSKDREQKEKENSDFKIVRACRSDFGEVVETAGEHYRSTNHRGDLEIRQPLVIEHPVKL